MSSCALPGSCGDQDRERVAAPPRADADVDLREARLVEHRAELIVPKPQPAVAEFGPDVGTGLTLLPSDPRIRERSCGFRRRRPATGL